MFTLQEDDMEQNSDPSMDETLDPITSYLRYVNSPIPIQRLSVVRSLADSCSVSPFERVVEEVFPTLSYPQQDMEAAIRQCLCHQLPLLAEYVMGANAVEGYNAIAHTLLPLAFSLSLDETPDVSQAGYLAVVDLAKYVREEHRNEWIVQKIVFLASSPYGDDNRSLALQFISALAPLLGPKICKENLIDIVELLAQDNAFTVRKVVAMTLPSFGGQLSLSDVESRLLPTYLKLCDDRIWSVRKAATDVLPGMAGLLSSATRISVIIPLVERLNMDGSRWVRQCVAQQLGRLIVLYEPEAVLDTMVRLFVDLSRPSKFDDVEEDDPVQCCAYSFPAVAFTLGKERWHLLEDSYARLCTSHLWKVRYSLACSLHEVARILGPQLTQRDLYHAFDNFLKDLDEVKSGLMYHINDFVALLDEEMRDEALQLAAHAASETVNWRIREEIGLQLAAACSIATPKCITTCILHVADVYFNNQFSLVREAGVMLWLAAMSRIRICKDYETLEQMCNSLRTLATDSYFVRRQIFLRTLTGICAHATLWDLALQFWDLLQTLVADRVPNVRLHAARAVAAACQHPRLRTEQLFTELFQKLEVDSDPDVLESIHMTIEQAARFPPFMIEQGMSHLATIGPLGPSASSAGGSTGSVSDAIDSDIPTPESDTHSGIDGSSAAAPTLGDSGSGGISSSDPADGAGGGDSLGGGGGISASLGGGSLESSGANTSGISLADHSTTSSPQSAAGSGSSSGSSVSASASSPASVSSSVLVSASAVSSSSLTSSPSSSASALSSSADAGNGAVDGSVDVDMLDSTDLGGDPRTLEDLENAESVSQLSDALHASDMDTSGSQESVAGTSSRSVGSGDHGSSVLGHAKE